MQNVPWFLPQIKTQLAKGMLAGMAMVMGVVMIAEVQANFDTDNLVYAKTGETVQTAVAVEPDTQDTLEESNAQVAQVQLDEEAMASFDESVAAMQNELAAQLAEVELEARIAKEREERKIKLSETDKNLDLILLIFQLRLLALIGFLPKISKCVVCDEKITNTMEKFYFSIRDDGVKCSACAKSDKGAIELNKTSFSALIYILSCDAKKLFSFIPLTFTCHIKNLRTSPFYQILFPQIHLRFSFAYLSI